MIRVGVTENVVLSKAELNDKGTLLISVREVGTEVKEKTAKTAAEMMADGSDDTGSSSGETTFMMFVPNVTKYDNKDEQEDGAKIMASFIDLKNQLAHFLKRFTTVQNIKFSPFAGVETNLADEKAIFAALQNLAVTEKVYKNYVTQFLAQIRPFLNMESKPSRLFLHRRSKTVHFGTLRKKFLDNQPFFEAMDLPIQQSKLYTKQIEGTTKFHDPIEIDGVKYVPAFSVYEIKNGLDDTAIIDAPADEAEVNETEIEQVEGLFQAGTSDQDIAGPDTFQITED